MCVCIGTGELFFFSISYCIDIASIISWKTLERFTTCNTTESKRDWADKWAPKIIEQARLETTTCSAASISCAQVIALGKRLYNKTVITLEAQCSNWNHQSYYCSLVT